MPTQEREITAEEREAEQARDMFRDMEAEAAGGMLRPISPERLALIRESMEMLGDLRRWFPVLLDVDGNVIDGRHRLEIDPEWPVARDRVTAEHRAAVATAANRTNSWTDAEWSALARRVRDTTASKREATRKLIRLALLEDASKADRTIGAQLDVSHHTVARVREEMEAAGEIQHVERKGSKGGAAPGPKPETAAEKTRKARERVGASIRRAGYAPDVVDEYLAQAGDPDEEDFNRWHAQVWTPAHAPEPAPEPAAPKLTEVPPPAPADEEPGKPGPAPERAADAARRRVGELFGEQPGSRTVDLGSLPEGETIDLGMLDQPEDATHLDEGPPIESPLDEGQVQAALAGIRAGQSRSEFAMAIGLGADSSKVREVWAAARERAIIAYSLIWHPSVASASLALPSIGFRAAPAYTDREVRAG